MLTVRALGVELLHIELADTTELDPAADLSGGDLGSTQVAAGSTDLYLGFTNGREV